MSCTKSGKWQLLSYSSFLCDCRLVFSCTFSVVSLFSSYIWLFPSVSVCYPDLYSIYDFRTSVYCCCHYFAHHIMTSAHHTKVNANHIMKMIITRQLILCITRPKRQFKVTRQDKRESHQHQKEHDHMFRKGYRFLIMQQQRLNIKSN